MEIGLVKFALVMQAVGQAMHYLSIGILQYLWLAQFISLGMLWWSIFTIFSLHLFLFFLFFEENVRFFWSRSGISFGENWISLFVSFLDVKQSMFTLLRSTSGVCRGPRYKHYDRIYKSAYSISCLLRIPPGSFSAYIIFLCIICIYYLSHF